MARAMRARPFVPGDFIEVPAAPEPVSADTLSDGEMAELTKLDAGLADPKVCEKNPKSHRHLPANLVDDRHSGCRFCGQPIERAHAKSTWWTLQAPDPSKKPSKIQLRRGKKLLKKAFAKKDQMGSTRRDAKRAAKAYAEERAGHSLSWKAARKLVRRWAREERMVTV